MGIAPGLRVLGLQGCGKIRILTRVGRVKIALLCPEGLQAGTVLGASSDMQVLSPFAQEQVDDKWPLPLQGIVPIPLCS
jgi:hypothetical protein